MARHRSRLNGRLLAASSVVALMVGSGATPALACLAVGRGFTNPVHATLSCISVTNTSFSGFLSNAGTITPGGIILQNGTIGGGVSGGIIDSGNILATGGNFGINVDSNSQINSFVPILIDGTGKTFTGGITNAGKLTGTSEVIYLFTPSLFTGGITNSGTLTATSTASGDGIAIDLHNVSTFTGGITNSGTISAENPIVDGAATFTGGITNTGTITAGQVGIWLLEGENFSGGITNAKTISASRSGIFVESTSFSGGINNTGTITSTASNGIVIGEGFDVSTFSGGINNAAGATIAAARSGILVAFVETFTGGITNNGTITAGGSRAGVEIAVGSTFSGGITNAGTISGGAQGIFVNTVELFSNDIVNGAGATIAGNHTGIFLAGIGSFGGGITNAGVISGGVAGIAINAVTSFAGNIVNSAGATISGGHTGISFTNLTSTGGFISNMGTITGGKGIVSAGGSVNDQTVDNYGTITGLSGTAIDASASALPVFIEENNGTINGTILFSSHGDLLFGEGTINGNLTTGNATVWPRLVGSGTLTINGTYTQGSAGTFMVDISPAAASKLVVNGGANLNGTLSLDYQPGVYSPRTYTLLTSAGVSGTFSTVAGTPPVGVTQTVTYTATAVDLTLTGSGVLGFFSDSQTPGTIIIPGASGNEQSVATAINNFVFSGGMLPPGFGILAALTDAPLLQALDQLSGEVGASFRFAGFTAGNLFLNAITNPFNFDRGGGFGPAQSFAAEEPAPSALPDDVALAYASILRPQGTAPLSFASRWSAWGTAYGGGGSINGDPAIGSHDTSSQVYGFAGGLDYRVTPDTVLGFALGGGGTSWNVSEGLGNGRSTMFQAAVYGSTRWGPLYVTGVLANSVHDVDTARTVTVAGSDALNASFLANVVSARLESGYRYDLGGFGATPYAAIQSQWMQLPSYSETATSGSLQFALSYPSQNLTDVRAELGAWLDKTMLLDRGSRLQLYARAAWANDSGSGAGTTALFQSLPGASFIVDGAKPDDNSALVSAGVKYAMLSGWSVMASFDGEFSGNTSIYSATGTIRKIW